MKRILAALAAALLLVALLSPQSAWAFGVKDVVSMSQAGIPDSLILQKIRHSGAEFDLNAKDMVALKRAGVSDPVVSAMLRTEDRDRTRVGYNGRYWPYDPTWSVGFDLGWYQPYDPFFHGPYRARRPYRFGSRIALQSRR